MSRQIGIDIRENFVRVAALQSRYRKVTLEGLREVELSRYATLEEALQAATEGLLQQHEGIAVAIPGADTFVHRVPLPPAALKQVEEVLPFELEAQIPVDFSELVYDSRVLPRERGEQNVDVLAVAAPKKAVEGLVSLTGRALGHEAERIGGGALPLGNLAQVCPELDVKDCVALLDVGENTSDLVLLQGGAIVFGRTLSVGVAGLPESAPALTGRIRQTLVAWAGMSEHPVRQLYLSGAGVLSPGMSEYLGAHLKVDVADLPKLQLENPGKQKSKAVAQYGKAIGLALGLRGGARDLNLRQGALSYQRGFGFLKDKLPLMTGLAAGVVASFVFSAWAETRSLTVENEHLATALATLSGQILAEETADAERVHELLDSGGKTEKDPQPEFDGFDLIVSLARLVPADMEHDITELELQRGKLSLRGLVPSAEDAQKLLEELKKERCFKDPKIGQISKELRGDRQKYTLELEVRCEDAPQKKPAREEEE